jgi:hypothetical protein
MQAGSCLAGRRLLQQAVAQEWLSRCLEQQQLQHKAYCSHAAASLKTAAVCKQQQCAVTAAAEDSVVAAAAAATATALTPLSVTCQSQMVLKGPAAAVVA